MKVQAIIPCAGVGARLKTDKTKPFVDLCTQPLFMHALKAFADAKSISSIILPVHQNEVENFKTIIAQSGVNKNIKVIAGGDTRRASVCNGLDQTDADTDIVVVHDAARPLVMPEIIDAVVKKCEESSAVIVAVPVNSTVKTVKDGVVVNTLKRSELWEVQTPQAFTKKILKEAHALKIDAEATDDAMLVELAGYAVHILQGSYTNIKVTTNEDLVIAEAFLKKEYQRAN